MILCVLFSHIHVWKIILLVVFFMLNAISHLYTYHRSLDYQKQQSNKHEIYNLNLTLIIWKVIPLIKFKFDNTSSQPRHRVIDLIPNISIEHAVQSGI